MFLSDNQARFFNGLKDNVSHIIKNQIKQNSQFDTVYKLCEKTINNQLVQIEKLNDILAGHKDLVLRMQRIETKLDERQ